MRPRTQSREAALHALFMCDFLNDWSVERCDLYFSHFEVDPKIAPYGSVLCKGVLTDLTFVEAQISRASDHWSISRMSRIDRCLLRMAVFELCRIRDVPRNVIVNEAIELAKLYCSENSPSFINGILDKICKMIDEDIDRQCFGSDHLTSKNTPFVDCSELIKSKMIA